MRKTPLLPWIPLWIRPEQKKLQVGKSKEFRERVEEPFPDQIYFHTLEINQVKFVQRGLSTVKEIRKEVG